MKSDQDTTINYKYIIKQLLLISLTHLSLHFIEADCHCLTREKVDIFMRKLEQIFLLNHDRS